MKERKPKYLRGERVKVKGFGEGEARCTFGTGAPYCYGVMLDSGRFVSALEKDMERLSAPTNVA